MVNTTSIGIGILIIAIALIVLFVAIRKFGFPLLKEGGSVFGDFGKGLTEFFDNLGKTSETETSEETVQREIAEEDFQEQVDLKQKQFEDSGFETFEEFEQKGDTNSIFNASLEELTKFNPPDTIGYGIEGLNEGRGIEDTEENRALLFDIIQSAGEKGITDVREVDFSSFTSSQFVKASEPTSISTIDTREAFIGDATFNTALRISEPTRTDPIIISRFQPNESFQVFSADPDQEVIGVIRETIQDPTQLQVDSFGNPIETASERASRVFEETGQFANESFDEITQKELDAQSKDFGTNTGDALKVDSSPELSIEEKKRIEAEKSESLFFKLFGSVA